MRHRGYPLVLFVAALAGCTSDPTAPVASTMIRGDFGGPTARLHADSAGALITLGCSTVSIAQPLTTDDAGRFLVSGVERSSAGPQPIDPTPGSLVTVEGLALVSGLRRIRLIIRPMVIDGPLPPGDTAFVTEGDPGNFPVCLAAGRG